MADPGNTTTSVAPHASWVSVADLLRGQVPVHSSEAVAVVAELCAVLVDRGVHVIPDAADVLISGAGKLSVRAQDHGDPNPVAMGRMLHSLLSAASPPVALRLFVTHAISSERYQTVSEFADALASYEIPGRETLIQSAHDRWVASRTDAAAASVEIPLRAHPVPEQKPKPTARARRVPRWAIATAAVAIVLGGAASAWLVAGLKAPGIPPISWASISSSVSTAIDRASAWVGARQQSPVAATEPNSTNAKRPRAAERRNSGASTRTGTPGINVTTADGFVEDTSTTSSIALADATVTSSDITSPNFVVSEASADVIDESESGDSVETPSAVQDAARVPDAIVYSRAFAGVMPPVMTTQQIASPGTLSPGLEAVSTIEVLVDESGEVEQVKLLSRPSPVLAAMLLSAAKTWKFRPALHDGEPVRYRLRLDVTTTRP
jgi:hypothetical protein